MAGRGSVWRLGVVALRSGRRCARASFHSAVAGWLSSKRNDALDRDRLERAVITAATQPAEVVMASLGPRALAFITSSSAPTPRFLAALAHLCRRTHHYDDVLLDAIAERVTAVSGRSFSESELGQLCADYTAMRARASTAVLDAATAALLDRASPHSMRTCSPLLLGRVCRSLQLAHHVDAFFLDAVVDTLRSRDLTAFDPGSLAAVTASLARLFQRSALEFSGQSEREPRDDVASVFALLAAEIGRRGLSEFDEAELAEVCFSFASANRGDAAMFDAASKELQRRDLRTFSAKALSRLCYAFAVVNIPDAATLLTAAVSAFIASDPSPPIRSTQVLWACCVASVWHVDALRVLLPRVDAAVDTIGTTGKYMLQQIVLSLELEAPPECAALVATLAPNMRRLAARSARGHGRPVPKSSLMHDEVSRGLMRLGVPHRNEYPCAAYFIDIVMRVSGRRVALEVHGPSHYVSGTRLLRGQALLRRRHLERLGWIVHAIPFWEWAVAHRSVEREDAYLLRLLDSIRGVVLLSDRKGPVP